MIMNIYKCGKVVAEYDAGNVSITTDDVKLRHYVIDGVTLNKKWDCECDRYEDDLVLYRPNHAVFFTAFIHKICMDGYSIKITGAI